MSRCNELCADIFRGDCRTELDLNMFVSRPALVSIRRSMSFSLPLQSNQDPTRTSTVRTIATTKYSHNHSEKTFPSRLELKSKNVVLKNVAVNVAGRKKIVIAAMTRITAESREVDTATSCEVSASFALVAASFRLIAESRWAMPLYT